MTRPFSLLPLLTCLSACGPDLYVMTEEHERVEGGPWAYMGGSCMEVGQGAGSGTGGGTAGSTADESYSIETVDDGVRVRVFKGSEVTKEKTFEREFLESGDKGRFAFAYGGHTRRVTVWGGPECVSPAEPDEEAIEDALSPRDAGTSNDAER